MEKVKEALHMALANLVANPVRSVLSILGIVIGIAAVIAILAFGAGARSVIMNRMGSGDVDAYSVYSSFDDKSGRMGVIDLDDVKHLEALPFVVSVTPSVTLYREVRSRFARQHVPLSGITSNRLDAMGVRLIKGRNLSPIEIENRAPLVLISDDTEDALFPGSEAVDGTVYIDEDPWTVIGVFTYGETVRKRARTAGGPMGPLLAAFAPLPTLIRTQKDVSLNRLDVKVRRDYGDDLPAQITETLERSDPQRMGLYRVADQGQMIEKRLQVEKSVTMVGVIIAGISLIVGGIGMMNVMLTTVAERTREIGIRRAVGARRLDILIQFLIESCALSLLGGIAGLFLGAALAHGAVAIMKQALTPQIKPLFVFIALTSGVVMGVLFGLYPAVKASRLSPADALRTE
jgi:putative ABC transport system permease protein